MDQGKLDYLKGNLLTEKERLENELDHSNELGLAHSLSETTAELSVYDNHPADLGSETFEREKDRALVSNQQHILRRINEALERMSSGEYGNCELCGREINGERLEALPYSTLCIDCQQEQDQHSNRRRPVEEEVLKPPFGRTFNDGRDIVATDGEDIWQAVARYGSSDSPSDVGGEASYDDMYIDSDEDHGIVDRMDGIIAGNPGDILEESDELKR